MIPRRLLVAVFTALARLSGGPSGPALAHVAEELRRLGRARSRRAVSSR